jgi:NAD(P)-dependent dehydrogenase (short-subunit alcohol dehydrogenase family)
MKTFEKSVAVVTGGGSGIGRGCALAFAQRGARLVVADINIERAQAVAEEALALGVDAVGVGCNVTLEADLIALRETASERFGQINLLMNNVGTLPVGKFEDISYSEWERTFQINLFSYVRATQIFLPNLRASGDSHIVNTASTAGLYTYGADCLSYNASKAAVISFSEGLALYLRDSGVGVTCLCPGPVQTNIVEQITFHGDTKTVTGPDNLQLHTAEAVGTLVAEAIVKGQFLLPTNPEIFSILINVARDPEAFLRR